MDVLPPEVLSAILGYAAGYAPAARAVCRRWRVLAPADGALKLRDLGAAGRVDLVAWVREVLGCKFQAVANEILYGAAGGGHELLCVLVRKWSASETVGSWSAWHTLHAAAYGGHLHICLLVKSWGATSFAGMLAGAAEGGREKLCIVAKAWGACSESAIDEMLVRAAFSYRPHICRLAKKWGASDADAIDAVLQCATENGDVRLCRLAKKWGASPAAVEKMLYTAEQEGNWQLCKLARRWGARSVSAIEEMRAVAELPTLRRPPSRA